MSRTRFRKPSDAPAPTPVTPLETPTTTPLARFLARLEGTMTGRFLLRILGVVGVAVLTGIYFQMVPLLLVLLGGYMGVNRLELTVDVLIYGLSGLAIVLPAVYFYTALVRALVRRLILARHPRLSSRS